MFICLNRSRFYRISFQKLLENILSSRSLGKCELIMLGVSEEEKQTLEKIEQEREDFSNPGWGRESGPQILLKQGLETCLILGASKEQVRSSEWGRSGSVGCNKSAAGTGLLVCVLKPADACQLKPVLQAVELKFIVFPSSLILLNTGSQGLSQTPMPPKWNVNTEPDNIRHHVGQDNEDVSSYC